LWSSKDLAFIIVFTVLNFVYTLLFGQLAWLFSGVPGSNLLLIIGGVIVNSFALLHFQGRRWRFAVYQILFAILVIPTFLLGVPFDVIARLPIVVVGIVSDVLFNSFFGFFKRQDKLMWWVIIDMIIFFLMTPFVTSIYFSFVYAPEFVSFFVNNVILLIPIVIIESVVGAIIGYKLYERGKKEGWFRQS